MQATVGPRQPTQRMFFALWPGANLQRSLARIAENMQVAFGGRVVVARNIHLTLAFVGSVPSGRVDELLAVGASVRASSFALDLIETGCWKRSAVGWIAPDASPQALDDLVFGLRQRLMKSRFHVDDKPFAPHVTLLRKAKCTARFGQSVQPRQSAQPAQSARPGRVAEPAGQQPSLRWEIDHFVLMRSDTLQSGPEYTRVGAWPLS